MSASFFLKGLFTVAFHQLSGKFMGKPAENTLDRKTFLHRFNWLRIFIALKKIHFIFGGKKSKKTFFFTMDITVPMLSKSNSLYYPHAVGVDTTILRMTK